MIQRMERRNNCAALAQIIRFRGTKIKTTTQIMIQSSGLPTMLLMHPDKKETRGLVNFYNPYAPHPPN
jgi:hypothetical protein